MTIQNIIQEALQEYATPRINYIKIKKDRTATARGEYMQVARADIWGFAVVGVGRTNAEALTNLFIKINL